MKGFLRLLGFLALLLAFAPGGSDAAGRSAWQSVQNKAPKQTPASAVSPEKAGLSLLEQETQSARVVGSEIRNFHLKPETKVSAADFFGRYAESLKLGKDDTMKAESVSPPLKIQGKAHQIVYHQQYFKGVPVLGARYNLIKDPDGNVVAGTGKIVSGLDIDVTPSVLEKDAFEAAKTAVPAKTYVWDKDPKKFPKGLLALRSDSKMSRDKFKLVWRFEISTVEPYGGYLVDIDAKTGQVDRLFNNVVEGSDENVTCTGPSEYDGTVTFTGSNVDGEYRLSCDPTYAGESCPVGLGAFDQRRPNTQGADPNQDSYFINSLGNADFSESTDIVGNSAYWAAQNALEYYWDHFGWSSFDGLGTTPVFLYLKNLPRHGAYYHSADGSIVFDAASDSNEGPHVSVDIVGHEFTHGVVAHTAELVYEKESGSLNEGFADIFGTLIKFAIPGKNATWVIAQDICLGAKCRTRDLGNPKADVDVYAQRHANLPPHDPDTYQGKNWMDTDGPCYGHCQEGDSTCDENNFNDYCGVHVNATVIGHWFYLLVNGGEGMNDLGKHYKVDPVAMDDAAQIAFDTMVYGLTPDSNFTDTRLASIQVAELQFGADSAQAKSVMNAWEAVGVGDAYDPNQSYSPSMGQENVPPWPATFTWEDRLPADLTRQMLFFIPPDRETITLKKATTHPADTSLRMGDQGDEGTNFLPVTEDTSNATLATPKLMVSSATLNLKPNTKYYWRTRTGKPKTTIHATTGIVHGVIDKFSGWLSGSEESTETEPEMDWSEWGPVYSLTTDKRAPTPTSPKTSRAATPLNGTDTPAGLMAYPWNPTFKFNPADGGTKYLLKVSETSELNPLTLHATSTPEGSAVFNGTGGTSPSRTTGGSDVSPIHQGPQLPDEEGSSGQNLLSNIDPVSGIWIDPLNPDNQDGSGLKDTFLVPLKVNATYYWGGQAFREVKDSEDGTIKETIEGDWSNDGVGQMFMTSTPQAELDSPANDAKLPPWGIELKWKATPGAVGYILNVSKDLSCVQSLNCADNLYTGDDLTASVTSAMINLPIESAGLTLTAGQNQATYGTGGGTPNFLSITPDYYWSVIPKGPAPYNEAGLAASPRGLQVDAEATKPELVSPPNNSREPDKQATVNFEWKAVAGAKEYHLTVAKNSNGKLGETVYAGSILDSEKVTPTRNLSGEEPYEYLKMDVSNVATDMAGYCWQVQAATSDGSQGLPSDTFCYGLGPDKPVLTSPANGKTDVDYNSVTFTWTSEWAPEGYTLYVNGSPFSTTEKSFTTSLQPSTSYEWDVYAGLDGWTTSSDHWTFTTKAPPCPTLSGTPSQIYPLGTSAQCSNAYTYPFQFEWTAVSGASQYDIKVFSYSDTSNPLFQGSYSGTTSDSVTLNCGTAYAWTVKARNSCGNSTGEEWSGYFSCATYSSPCP